MRKIAILLASIIATAAASTVQAVPFNELEEWSRGKLYRRGDVVRYVYDIYINILPSRSNAPGTETPRWKKIDYDARTEFSEHALYPLGTVVSHKGKYYISLSMNAVHDANDLTNSSRWQEFTHPGLTYSLPPETATPEEITSILGADKNLNAIRDDYERKIVFSSLPPAVKEAALSAGKTYGSLMKLATDPKGVNSDEAQGIVRSLVLARACRREMQQLHQGVTWQESTYFNTIDRIEAKFKLQNILASVLEATGSDLQRPLSPCAALTSMY